MSSDSACGAPVLETKFMALGADPVAADGALEGYASLFDTPDDGLDEVAPGAFAASLARADRRVRMLWQHDPTRPIGVWDALREDRRGLRVRGRLVMETRDGAEAAALLRAGAIDGLSIGYRVARSSRLPSGGRRLLEIELWEISLVTFPMLVGARAVSAGAATKRAARALTTRLDEARRLFD
jgi:HK97 family phage prohead protease